MKSDLESVAASLVKGGLNSADASKALQVLVNAGHIEAAATKPSFLVDGRSSVRPLMPRVIRHAQHLPKQAVNLDRGMVDFLLSVLP
jgi:hypothetical protein